jgi:HEAT repeat protein
MSGDAALPPKGKRVGRSRRKSLTRELPHINRLARDGQSDALVRLLREPASMGSSRRREAIVHALGVSGGEDAFDALVMVLGKSNEARGVRYEAARALGQIGDRRAVASLSDAARAADVALRVSAVVGLGRLRCPEALEPLLSALGDKRPVVRSHAAEGLGGIGGARAVRALETALDDRKQIVRLSAAKSLAQVGDDRPSPRSAAEPNVSASSQCVALWSNWWSSSRRA